MIDRLSAMASFNRIGEPDDIARMVLLLASDESSWVTCQNSGVNGGFA